MKLKWKKILAGILVMAMSVSGGTRVMGSPKAGEEAITLTATDDVYVQGGKTADKVYADIPSSGSVLRIKSGTADYTRHTLLKFDISSLKNVDVGEAELRLQMGENMGTSFEKAYIYKVDNNWEGTKVTYNTKPKAVSTTPDVTITKADVYGTTPGSMVAIDLTELVSSALQKGETTISLELTSDDQNPDGGQRNTAMIFYSTRSGGEKLPPCLKIYPSKSQPDPVFRELREKWLDNLLGGELDRSNEAVNIYISNQDDKANRYWDSMKKSDDLSRSNLWDDLDMSYLQGTGDTAKVHSGNVAETFYRLKDIAVAWATEGCQIYQKEDVKTELIKALDFMNENHYSDSDVNTPVFGNWWHWEIGGPIAFMDTALILYDHLTPGQIRSYGNAVNRFTNVCDKPSGYPGSPAMSGANLIDKGMAVVQVGILTENGAKLDHVKSAYKTVFRYVDSGDGFYRDGSFIQHAALAYMGGYGSQLYEKLGILFNVLAGSDYELSYDDHSEDLVFDMVFEGIEPFLYNGLCMDMISGRDITRNTSSDKERGAELMDALMPLGDAMPGEQRDRFNSMMKYYIGIDEDYYYNQSTHIASLMKANEIMKDSSIKPRSGYALHKLFASMDKLVHITSDYGFALSMHSSRTYGHELINSEGKRTWNIADGMTYLYSDDREQYGEGYWATVNPKRLAGTTTEYVERPAGAGDRTTNIYSWVGGSSIGSWGSAGMHFRTLGNSGNGRTGTDAKKSWFMFDNEIVALGSGITSSTGNYVETIVDNRKLKADGSNRVTADGTETDVQDDGQETPEKGTLLKQISWLHLEGNTAGSHIGYYFPEKADIMALKERRNGNWNTQGTTEGEETNEFATFWFEHGRSPENQDYAYVILPGMNPQTTEEYAQNPQIQVIERSVDAHGVKENTLGITAVNFWNDKEKTVAGITSDRASSVTMKFDGQQVTAGISDPTQENTETIHVTLPYTGGAVKAKDSNIEVLETVPFIKLAVKTGGLKGQTVRITMEASEVSRLEITGLAEEPAEIQTDLGVKFADLTLPETVKVYDHTGGVHELEVQWQRGDYQKDYAGVYEIPGILVLSDGLYNTANIQAKLYIMAGQTEIYSTDDVFVQGGADGDKNFKSSTSGLIVKYDQNSQTYTRKSLIKFDIRQAPVEKEQIYLTLQIKEGVPEKDFTLAQIWQVENNWSDHTVTFNTSPDRIGAEPAAVLTRDEATREKVVKFDVASIIRAAREAGETEVSFEISIPTQAPNNYIEFLSSRTTVKDGIRPCLTWDIPEYRPEKMKIENLRFVVDQVASSVESSEFINADMTRLEELIVMARQVLVDPDATMEEIHEMERLLTEEMVKYRRK
ncbi:MAG: polysaccharide lyase 8 family protein [Hungatella sp.]|jgi:hypothetical protein|nr:polysaccharide lyase 8 family protein [Hungatella sp.]